MSAKIRTIHAMVDTAETPDIMNKIAF